MDFHLLFSPTSFRYIKDTIWNSRGPEAYMKWLLVIPSAAFQPEGYLIPEMGPKIAEGKGLEEQDESVKRLMNQNRGGCPFRLSL
jgi:hypothetical protein